MDDFPDAAVFPRALLGEDAPERSAPAAIPGPVSLAWIKGATARIAGNLILARGRVSVGAACLLGVGWLAWSHVHSRAPAPPTAEISRPAQTAGQESPAPDAEAMRAAQSLKAAEATDSETAKPLEAAKSESDLGAGAETAAKAAPLPPKPAEKLPKGGERVDRIGLEIAALLAPAPAADHSAPAAPAARKRAPKARHDAFDPALHPNAPGAPRPLGTIPSAAAKKTSAQYAYKQAAN